MTRSEKYYQQLTNNGAMDEGVRTYEAEELKDQIGRLIATGSGIDKVAETIYAGEYQAGADIRTDRFDIALDGMIKGEHLTQREKAAELQRINAPPETTETTENQTQT